MDNHIHIHEVLHLLAEKESGISEEALITEVKETFGDNVTFGTCGEHVLQPEQIVEFMSNRQKIVANKEGLILLNRMQESCS